MGLGAVRTNFALLGGEIYLEFNGSTLTHRFMPGTSIDMNLAIEEIQAAPTPNKVLWSLPDHQGTVRDVVNDSGVVQNHIEYDTFGNITSESDGSVDYRFTYTGREHDAETGLYYYRARYYDASVGKFISEDPKSFAAGDANLYRYVTNSPMMGTDAMGEDTTGLHQLGQQNGDAYREVGKAAWGFLRYWVWEGTGHNLAKLERKLRPSRSFDPVKAFKKGPVIDLRKLTNKGLNAIHRQFVHDATRPYTQVEKDSHFYGSLAAANRGCAKLILGAGDLMCAGGSMINDSAVTAGAFIDQGGDWRNSWIYEDYWDGRAERSIRSVFDTVNRFEAERWKEYHQVGGGAKGAFVFAAGTVVHAGKHLPGGSQAWVVMDAVEKGKWTTAHSRRIGEGAPSTLLTLAATYGINAKAAGAPGELLPRTGPLYVKAPKKGPPVLKNQAVGNSWDDYVAIKKLRRLDERGLLGRQERLPTPDIPGKKYVKPDYTIWRTRAGVAAYADAKSGAIVFDAQARGLIEWSTVTQSKQLIYYVPKPTSLPRKMVSYAVQRGVRIRVIVVK